MIPGIVLTGGASSRMGHRPKALLPTERDNQTFLQRIVSALCQGGVDDVLVVTGYHHDEIAEAVQQARLPVRVVRNPNPQRGQLSSLQSALKVVDHPGVQAVLVTLIDLPLLSPSTVRAVLETYRSSGAPLVRPARNQRHGHPVVFDRLLFEELRQADPERGAKPIVRAHAAEGCEVTVDDDGAFSDVDTPEDYRRVFGRPLPQDDN